MPCKYKDIFGKPGEGPHKYRVAGFAIIDIIFTLIAAYLISKYMKYNFYYTTIILFISAIFIHRIFSVETKLNSLIFN